MDLPSSIKDSRLYTKLSSDEELTASIVLLRRNATSMADTIARVVPTFTDHSIRHMDALWNVADRILTDTEIDNITAAEAFLLTSGFYLHDIGMAYAATPNGLDEIRQSSAYKSALASNSAASASTKEARAIAVAVRSLHATAAAELAVNEIPGTSVFLLEPREIREAWGATAGAIASSHHWSLDKVDLEFGRLQVAALPGGRRGDLAFVASMLRIIDYAHINRDRAPTIDRALRTGIQEDSLVHWLAQESIDGPEREGQYLLYRAAIRIKDVDAWWLYFDMLKGLDQEIRSVRRYLDGRIPSKGRFSLAGVRGTDSAEQLAVYVPTDGFMPLEVNVRTGSIDRLVQLLAGESLYGPNPMAAVRELLQNARDAVTLKAATASTDFDKAALAIPIRVSFKTTASPTLEVVDYGIGMTKKVMTEYLITIASDYWNSQFHVDFPSIQGFRPVGKFGIGFLAVFMLGDLVTVESNRAGEERYRMSLRGIGRRGEIRPVALSTGSGTAVRVQLRATDALKNLGERVRIYAPMLKHPVDVDENGSVTRIEVNWIDKLSPLELREWTLKAAQEILKDRSNTKSVEHMQFDGYFMRRYLRGGQRQQDWHEIWPHYSEEGVRLAAGFEGVSILCVKGFTVQTIRTPGFVGVVDLSDGRVDVSRRQALDADVSDLLERAKAGVKALVVSNLNKLDKQSFIVNELSFVAQCVSAYGRAILLESTLPWISQLKSPGNVIQIDSTSFLAQLAASNSLFLAYGTGPWSAIKEWSKHPIAPNELAVVLDEGHDGVRPEYVSSDNEKIGPLGDLWQECEEGFLFGTLLGIVAEAWQVSTSFLLEQDGWHHVGTRVWGRFTRP